MAPHPHRKKHHVGSLERLPAGWMAPAALVPEVGPSLSKKGKSRQPSSPAAAQAALSLPGFDITLTCAKVTQK